MSAPRKFDEETRARAVRLYQDRLRDHGESKLTAQARRRPARHQACDAAELDRGRETRGCAGRRAGLRRFGGYG